MRFRVKCAGLRSVEGIFKVKEEPRGGVLSVSGGTQSDTEESL